MTTKYTLATERSLSLVQGGKQLSDGTVVWLGYDNAAAAGSKYKIHYSTDRSTVNTVATLAGGATAGKFSESNNAYFFMALAVDASDNIYVVGQAGSSSTSYLFQAFAKGTGFTWAASTTVTISLAHNYVLAFTWANTGGGTGSGGHLVMVSSLTTSGQVMMTLDAGALLNNTHGTAFINTSTLVGSAGFADLPIADIAHEGASAASGVFASISGALSGGNYSGSTYTWSVSSAGVITQGALSSGPWTVRGPASGTLYRLRVFRLAANTYCVLRAAPYSTGLIGLLKALVITTGNVTRGDFAAPTTYANWPADVSSAGNGGGKGAWDAVTDTLGHFWAYAPSTSPYTTVLRVGATWNSGTNLLTWDPVATGTPVVDDTSVSSLSATGALIVTVPRPRVYRADWWVTNISASVMGTFGDYSDLRPPKPTTIKPVNGATVNTDVPTLWATIVAASLRQKVTWQLATDSAFTVNVRSFTTSAFSTSGQVSLAVPAGSGTELFQTTWYVRAQTTYEGSGAISDWSATQSFVVSHAPATAGWTPTANSYVPFGASFTLNWNFSDTSPVDFQTALQVIVERNSDGLVIVDSGKITSGVSARNVTIPSTYKDVPLRWKVRVWDSDDVAGAYSAYQLFTVADPPTVNITSPLNNAVVTTAQPQTVWSFTAPGGRTQASWRLVWTDATTGNVVYDSDIKAGAATAHTPSIPVLVNNGTYTVMVTVVDSGGLSDDSNVIQVTTLWTPATRPVFTIDNSPFLNSGYVHLDWHTSTVDSDFYSWRVYERVTGTTPWKLVFETTSSTVTTYDDFMLPSNTSVDYAVVQVAQRFGTQLVESTYPVHATIGLSLDYWLLVPDNPAISCALKSVTADSFKEEYEESTLTVIGRGRHVDKGTRLGFSGSLTAQLRDVVGGDTASVQLLKLQAVRATQAWVFLRNPFGDMWMVDTSDISFDRLAGVGLLEYGTATIPYQEVSD